MGRSVPKNGDALALLSVDAIQDHPPAVAEFQGLSRQLRVPIGWHYLLDLSWLADELNGCPPAMIVDAGAGMGLLQWYLARRGNTVISIDRAWRAHPGWRFYREAVIGGWTRADAPRNSWSQVGRLFSVRRSAGKVLFHRANLAELSAIPTSSIDLVVSVSALEHNELDQLPQVVSELLRVLRPGGRLLATTSGAMERDWFHEPSRGWCFTEETLRRLFQLEEGAFSNFSDYSSEFEKLKRCQFLQDHLDPIYKRRGDNGMPWGEWRPMYHPVAVRKIKG